jgi:predicted DNA-binding transcriptional regulator AlpA
MTRRACIYDPDQDDLDLDPNEIIRPKDGRKYFGYGHSQLAELIKQGEIPPPFPLSETGVAKGWTGRQIIEHHRRRIALRNRKQPP